MGQEAQVLLSTSSDRAIVKSDHHLGRCYLKGSIGDAINAVVAACAWNLKKWLAMFFGLLKKPILLHEWSGYDDEDGLQI